MIKMFSNNNLQAQGKSKIEADFPKIYQSSMF